MPSEHSLRANSADGDEQPRSCKRRYGEVADLAWSRPPAHGDLSRSRPKCAHRVRDGIGLGAAPPHRRLAGGTELATWSARMNRRLSSPTAIIIVKSGDSSES